MIAAARLPVQVACRMLGVSESGFYEQRSRPPSQRVVRHAWLTDLITEVHLASHGRYGTRRVDAELTMARGILVGHQQVELLMRRAGLKGLAGRRKWKRIIPDQIATDLVERNFTRAQPNQLWVTDITEHRTREGKVYCCVVLDTFSRRVVGWSIDSSPTAALATNVLGMAIETRLGGQPAPGTVIHSDQGVQGGINRSSQHLEFGGVRAWPQRTGARRPAMRLRSFVGSGVLTGRCGQRCARPGVLTRPGRCNGSSGG